MALARLSLPALCPMAGVKGEDKVRDYGNLKVGIGQIVDRQDLLRLKEALEDASSPLIFDGLVVSNEGY